MTPFGNRVRACGNFLSALAACLLLVAAMPWTGPALGSAPDHKGAPDELSRARNRMVDEEIVAAGVKDPRVIDAMRRTPRHEFVPGPLRDKAYLDMALPIGQSQTISPPFVVAYMTEQIDPRPADKVLEIGTGSGYQAAVLSPLVKEVYTIEIVKPLAVRARQALKRLKYRNVMTKIGDGYQGWPEHAPFDKIIVTCSPEKVPPALVEQLREGGRMVVPVGERYQQTLYLFEKKNGKLASVALLPTLFVPMTGRAEDTRAVKPDAANPVINNGSFERLLGEDGPAAAPSATSSGGGTAPLQRKPAGWHYQRQLTLVDDSQAPDGARYVTFTNQEPGRGSQALQGLAVDGRKVKQLELSLQVRGEDIQQGRTSEELPVVLVLFYDETRAQRGYNFIGPWRGTFAWRSASDTISVPQAAREVIIHIGLHGATGQISFDDIRLRAIARK